MRKKLLINLAESFSSESAFFMVLAWDYVFNPTDRKIECIRDLYIDANSYCSVNIPSAHRMIAMAILTGARLPGDTYVPTSPAMGGRMRSAVVMSPVVGRGRAAGVSARPGAGPVAGRPAGFARSGTANYNLATKAIEPLVVDVGLLIREKVGSPSQFHERPQVAAVPGGDAEDHFRLVRPYWGDGVKRLFGCG